MELEYIYPRTS